MSRIITTTIVIATMLCSLPAFGTTLLHEFAGGADGGDRPLGSLILSGSTLYGMTYYGGNDAYGVVFKVNTDGSGHTLLHEFAGGADDGRHPRGSLVLSGSTLYGMTEDGGDNDKGVVFKVNTDGSGYGLLHEFAGGVDDGRRPCGSLILSGSTLYGMTNGGGVFDRGVVFNMNTDGSGFGLLHEFGGADDGEHPWGWLTLSGSTLYGMTCVGGNNDFGVVFRVNTDGNDYGLLHKFAGGVDDGRNPYGSLTLSGSTLYGMTYYGGDNDKGVVFKVNTDGGGYGLLHEFAGYPDDGEWPWGSLTIFGSTLYGMTMYGGNGGGTGVVFEVNTDTSGYDLLHEFAGGVNDGSKPYGSLIVSDTTLYGMTFRGGDYDKGVVFALAIPEPSTILLLAPALLGFAGVVLKRRK